MINCVRTQPGRTSQWTSLKSRICVCAPSSASARTSWTRRRISSSIFGLAQAIALAGESDEPADAFNYRTITKAIIQVVEASRFSLVEKLAEEIARLAIVDFGAPYIEVNARKPGALRRSDSVGIRIERRPGDYARNIAYVSLGSNMQPEENVAAAVHLLRGCATVLDVSPVYRTPPQLDVNQAPFLIWRSKSTAAGRRRSSKPRSSTASRRGSSASAIHRTRMRRARSIWISRSGTTKSWSTAVDPGACRMRTFFVSLTWRFPWPISRPITGILKRANHLEKSPRAWIPSALQRLTLDLRLRRI